MVVGNEKLYKFQIDRNSFFILILHVNLMIKLVIYEY